MNNGEAENAIKAINQVGLYQYVEKPWDNDEVRLIIRNGLEKKQLMAKLTQKVLVGAVVAGRAAL